MQTFIFWCDKPFNPRRVPALPVPRRARFVTIRYQGSFGRSAVKTVIVLVLLAAMLKIMG